MFPVPAAPGCWGARRRSDRPRRDRSEVLYMERIPARMTMGIDIGSTTVKIIIVKNGDVVYQQYERHMSQVRPKTLELIRMAKDVIGGGELTVALSGSAGLGVAKAAGLPFIQEVFATGEVVKSYAPDTDCVIELGGEDAKIIFFTGGLEERMNGSCAGGTGAFIDQMATLLDVTPEQLDTLSLGSEKLYTIASRCGVFAKSDIQPLLNQGARKEDIAASIFKAVVDQTITGLAQGRRITGKVLFLGGPLYYFKGLQREFVRSLGLFARYPVDLGSRCTVFMNSSVKQAQKEGAGVEDISAGISISVVKNAIYKVIRAHSAEELGQSIVVQGGTFLNDAVLRSFEREIGHDVVRPAIAGLMGAYGAALYARELALPESSLISAEELEEFRHESRSVTCGLCGNHCNLTVNTFGGGKKFISGNRCERPLGRGAGEPLPNLFAWKLEQLEALKPLPGRRGKIGVPLGLNMLENLPFWHAFLTALGFEVVTSGVSTRETYIKGQFSIPSDTVCYPAKLMHGHIADLLEQGVTTIFYPCMTYNFDEKKGDNHYNCPVVAYYPELLRANVSELSEPGVHFLYPHVGIHRPAKFADKLFHNLRAVYPDLTLREVREAARTAYAAYDDWMKAVKAEGRRAIAWAREQGKKIVVLSGRPYHIDPEINHGIDRLIASFGIVVVSEDCVADLVEPVKVHVLNQWTYHARLYNAAKYVTAQPDMELVQLVSFGCGIDAITTDEVRDILEAGGKLCTQLKIDEITNLGAVRIRIRSLLEAVEERERSHAATK